MFVSAFAMDEVPSLMFLAEDLNEKQITGDHEA
jgi:hypothetical protein